MRVKAIIAYDGSRFGGSQIQPHTSSVAGTITHALKALGIDDSPLFSGRTDKGVHATGQVISFTIPPFWSNIQRLQQTLNQSLSPYIFIKQLSVVPDSFHPRFDAKARLYRYMFHTSSFNPVLAHSVNQRYVDEKRLQDVVPYFYGEHNFIYFKKNDPWMKENFVRTLFRVSCYRYHSLVILSFLGNAFLRSQIRLMVGALLAFHDHKITSLQLQEQLNAQQHHTHELAPAHGLYLAKVLY